MGPGPDGWGPYHDAAMALVEGVDVLLHDAQYTEAELATRPHFGHSCVEYALELAERAGSAGCCSTTTIRDAPTIRSTRWSSPASAARSRSPPLGEIDTVVV